MLSILPKGTVPLGSLPSAQQWTSSLPPPLAAAETTTFKVDYEDDWVEPTTAMQCIRRDKKTRSAEKGTTGQREEGNNNCCANDACASLDCCSTGRRYSCSWATARFLRPSADTTILRHLRKSLLR